MIGYIFSASLLLALCYFLLFVADEFSRLPGDLEVDLLAAVSRS